MYKLQVGWLVFFGLILVLSSHSFAIPDHIEIYRDKDYTEKAIAFDDGSKVYVEVTDLVTTITSATVTVANIDIEGYSIDVPVTNSETPSISEDPTLYFGKFEIHSSWENLQSELRMLSGQTAVVTADLDNAGDAASAQIVAMYLPPPPENLKTTTLAGGGAELTWDASYPEDTVEKYNIYRSTTSITPGDWNNKTPIGTVDATHSSSYKYSDTGLETGKTYYYLVTAEDSTEDEAASNQVLIQAKKDLLLCKLTSEVVRQNSSLQLTLSAAESLKVSIKVVNLTGEIVKEDVISLPAQQEITWNWNGRNMHGQKVNNGLYILLVETDGGKQTKRKTVGVIF